MHVHVRSNGLAAVAVCDAEYPSRVAFTLLMKVQEDFMTAHADATWLDATDELAFPPLDDMIRKYQDPHEADAIMKIQKDLDDTKIILHKTIDSVLERGVKLDNLVEKSTDLSAQSKMYVVCRLGQLVSGRRGRAVLTRCATVHAVLTSCRFYSCLVMTCPLFAVSLRHANLD